MKVYEIMAKLESLPAGAEVKVCTIKTTNEMTLVDDDLYEINFPVRCIDVNHNQEDPIVIIDCY